MKKKILSAILSVFMLMNCCVTLGLAEDKAPWANASEWAVTELEKAESTELIPDILNDADYTKNVTREEFAEISVKVYENLSKTVAETSEENPFADTENPEILKAYALGITNGMTDTTFAPEEKLTREQAAVMLARAYSKAMNIQELKAKDDTQKFADDEMISPWAKDSVYFMASNGIISGIEDNKFAPGYSTEEEENAGYGCATREQALLIAVRICEAFAQNEDEPADENKEEVKTEDNTEEKTEENTSDEEKTEDTEEDADKEPTIEEIQGGQPPEVIAEQNMVSEDKTKEDYTIAFIGGSLTQGGGTWISRVRAYFQEKYPDKNILTVNAGVGGTGSEQGALRYEKDVLDRNPDLVFIEFAVNDGGRTEEESKVYMENMVRQSLEAEKVPAIIFLYAPTPSESQDTWRRGVNWKQEIADHYKLKSINVFDYIYDEFLEKKKEDPSLKLFDYFGKIGYTKSGSGYDVHGGYVKYGEAIVKELDADFEGCLTVPEKVGIKTTSAAKERYRHINVASSRMHYTKDHWDKFTGSNKYTGSTEGHDIAGSMYGFPFFPEGIRQTEINGAMFGYDSTPGTTAIRMSYPSSKAGASATVTIDGKEAGTFSCYSQYHNVNYVTKWIVVPNDGQSHKIIVTVNGINPADNKTVFRFGSIIEKYTN